MMQRIRSATVILGVLASSACFHATVVTGLPASSEVITKQWAHGFIYGLVSPSTVETAAKCKSGVAKVETQLSFLNMLASALTFSLYTPMQIDVTCAASNKMALAPTETVTPTDASISALHQAIADAATASGEQNKAIYVVVK